MWTFLVVLLLVLAPQAAREPARPAGADPPKQQLPEEADLERYYTEQMSELEGWLDRRLESSAAARERFWKRDFSSPQAYRRSVEPYGREFARIIGGLGLAEKPPLEPRREPVRRNETYAVYRVWLRATRELHTYGLLLVPHTATAAAPGPALICVHGMGGSPEQVAGLVPRPDYLRAFGARAAERGFVVFAPLMSKSVRAKSRLDRKAILLGTRLQGIEQSKVLRAVDYLETLPEVARGRIGIYGISWGGRTALYAGALDQRLAAVAVSGHFNETVPKMVQASPHYTAYVDTAEDYAFFDNLANTFSDSDLGSLICPRPIFIEQGTRDRVAYVEMARREFTRLQAFYRRLGVEERAEMGVFEGEHFVHGDDAFRFFEKWLK